MKDVKLGFIVERTKDEIIVETLARRLLPPTVRFYTVPMGHKSGFYSAYITVVKFVQKAYDRVIIVFDTDTADPIRINERQGCYEPQFKKYGLEKHITLCPAVLQIESWLLANYVERPERYSLPREELAEAIQVEKLTETDIQQLAKTADIDLMRNRSSSFDFFVNTLQATLTVEDEKLE